MTKQTLENLEKKFSLATTLVDDMNDLVEEFTSDLVCCDDILPEKYVESEAMFEVSNLKSDFQLVRQNIIKLVNNGQRILDKASEIDIEDMKPSTLSALAELQSTIGNNLKLLIDTYKTMADIDKTTKAPTKGQTVDASGIVNNTQNNVIFSGSSSQLLDLIAGKPMLQ